MIAICYHRFILLSRLSLTQVPIRWLCLQVDGKSVVVFPTSLSCLFSLFKHFLIAKKQLIIQMNSFVTHALSRRICQLDERIGGLVFGEREREKKTKRAK